MMSSKTQQFCLRWNNHQASLASSLPGLLDSARFADVTLSAGGRTMRAHRVLLASCSEFFSELFATLGPAVQPVVVIPGVSFSSLCALITFVYSGEVTIFEDQLLQILSLADTLGIKGLANQQATATPDCAMDYSNSDRSTETMNGSTPERKTLSARYHPTLNFDNPSSVFQGFADNIETNNNNSNVSRNTLTNNLATTLDLQPPQAHIQKPTEQETSKIEPANVDNVEMREPRKIDIIAELLQCGAGKREATNQAQAEPQAKVYATCFICQKRLSNQYNLRVHLDTHRDAQYACHVCRHVSRSRDALRKHVSYRHPGSAKANPDGTGRRRNPAPKTTNAAAMETVPPVVLGAEGSTIVP